MPFRLRDNLHWCICGGQIIFLDLEMDRYFRLPAAGEAAFERAGDGRTQPEDRERLRSLIARGMLIEDASSGGLGSPPALPPAIRDFPYEAYASPGIAAVVRVLVLEIRVTRLLRSRPLLDVLKTIQHSRADRCNPFLHDDRRLGAIAGASATVSLIMRAADRCLIRAIAVHWACRRCGIYPKLVFGVRTNPFAAHCWVQLDDTVLVGDFEQVRLFTPILVLG